MQIAPITNTVYMAYARSRSAARMSLANSTRFHSASCYTVSSSYMCEYAQEGTALLAAGLNPALASSGARHRGRSRKCMGDDAVRVLPASRRTWSLLHPPGTSVCIAGASCLHPVAPFPSPRCAGSPFSCASRTPSARIPPSLPLRAFFLSVCFGRGRERK